ncbi:MAG: dipeptide epimerase [Saprospiraceae bacterium]|nr:MAG: dipeptide epimerase [Saprospiraceae bacterium]
MKITHLECWQHEMKLSEPFTIAYETIDRCVNVFLRIETNTGITGMGCAAPDLPVTGETAATVLTAFKECIEPVLKGRDPFTYKRLNHELKKSLAKHPAAHAMADMALYDIMARKAGVPVYKLLGGYRDSIPTSITIGILPLEETLEKTRQFLAQGFRCIKIKGGKNLEEDVEKILKIRETTGPALGIRFDANQGYTVAEAIAFIDKTRSANIELLEQPTAKHDNELLKQVTQNVHVLVMADESLMTLFDVFHLTRHDCTDMINIKLMKTGGIAEALHINSVAKAAGVDVMVGCMDESALGIAAALHFALARPNIRYADLDGHLDLTGDPFAAMVVLRDGVLYPKEGAGLGDI